MTKTQDSTREMEHDPNRKCDHGRRLWWNFGDGKPRHISERFGPVASVCSSPGSA